MSAGNMAVSINFTSMKEKSLKNLGNSIINIPLALKEDNNR